MAINLNWFDVDNNEKQLKKDRSKFISNKHLERKEKQAYRNYKSYRKKTRSSCSDYWYRTWCKILCKLRRQGNKYTCWSDWGREEYYLYKP